MTGDPFTVLGFFTELDMRVLEMILETDDTVLLFLDDRQERIEYSHYPQ